MTDNESAPVTPRRPPPRRARPAPKTKTEPTNGTNQPTQPATLPNGLPDRLAEMEAWDRSIAARQRPLDEAPARHVLDYNYPLAWYRRPDGDIVQLQSDPNNRAMYEDLGFVALSRKESREWEQVRQPQVIADQRGKA